MHRWHCLSVVTCPGCVYHVQHCCARRPFLCNITRARSTQGGDSTVAINRYGHRSLCHVLLWNAASQLGWCKSLQLKDSVFCSDRLIYQTAGYVAINDVLPLDKPDLIIPKQKLRFPGHQIKLGESDWVCDYASWASSAMEVVTKTTFDTKVA